MAQNVERKSLSEALRNFKQDPMERLIESLSMVGSLMVLAAYEKNLEYKQWFIDQAIRYGLPDQAAYDDLRSIAFRTNGGEYWDTGKEPTDGRDNT